MRIGVTGSRTGHRFRSLVPRLMLAEVRAKGSRVFVVSEAAWGGEGGGFFGRTLARSDAGVSAGRQRSASRSRYADKRQWRCCDLSVLIGVDGHRAGRLRRRPAIRHLARVRSRSASTDRTSPPIEVRARFVFSRHTGFGRTRELRPDVAGAAARRDGALAPRRGVSSGCQQRA